MDEMKKYLLMLMILTLAFLAGCTEVNVDYLKLELNPGVDTIELGSSHVDQGAQASYGLRILEVIVVAHEVDVNRVGTYEIIYQATYSGITKTIRRIVDVIDQKAPILTLKPGIDTILINQEWIDAGILVEDESGIESILTTGTVGNLPGDYQITYVVTDIYGNQSSITRIVSIIDVIS
jgi:hypothetical protein